MSQEEEGLVPKTILLGHQQPSTEYKALEDGILMYNPENSLVVYSLNGVWTALSSAGGTPTPADAVLRKPTFNAQSTITVLDPNVRNLTLVAADGQIADMVQMQDHLGVEMSSFDNLGNPQEMIIDGGLDA
jgi:hypothetical protein